MKRWSIRVVWAKLEIKQEVILYLGTYPLPQSDTTSGPKYKTQMTFFGEIKVAKQVIKL